MHSEIQAHLTELVEVPGKPALNITFEQAIRDLGSEFTQLVRETNGILNLPEGDKKTEKLEALKEKALLMFGEVGFDISLSSPGPDQDKLYQKAEALQFLVSKIIEGRPQPEVLGTETVQVFFKDILRIPDWETLPAREKTRLIWEYVKANVILAATNGNSAWIDLGSVGILQKQIDGLPQTNNTVEKLFASLRGIDAEHAALANRIETDCYKIQKILRIGNALQSIQKDVDKLAAFFSERSNILDEDDWASGISRMGSGYTDPPLGVQFARAFVYLDALSRPKMKLIAYERDHKTHYLNYPESSKYSPFPQSLRTESGLFTRMAIRKAIGDLQKNDNLSIAMADPSRKQRKELVKTILVNRIKEMEANAKAKGINSPVFDLNDTENEAQKRIANDGHLAEILAMNLAEISLTSPEYDAGAIIPPVGMPGAPEYHGEIPVLKKIDGFTATFVPTKATWEGLYRAKLFTDAGGSGTVGPAISVPYFPRTGGSILDYTFVKDSAFSDPKFLKTQGQTLRDAFWDVKTIDDFARIFETNKIGNMFEMQQGVFESFFVIHKKILNWGVNWSNIKHVEPGTEGLQVSFDPEIGKQIKGAARDVYYLLTRNNLAAKTYIFADGENGREKIRFDGPTANADYDLYRQLENQCRALPDEAARQAFIETKWPEPGQFIRRADQFRVLPDATAKTAFIAALGAEGSSFEALFNTYEALPTDEEKNRFIETNWPQGFLFQRRYRRLNFVPAQGFGLYDGFDEDIGDPRKAMRFSARFLDFAVRLPRSPRLVNGETKLIIDVSMMDDFEKAIYVQAQKTNDWFTALNNLMLGKLIIGDMRNKSASTNMTFDDGRALMGVLCKPYWDHEMNMFAARILRRLNRMPPQDHAYDGYGKFTYDQSAAILRMAGVDMSIISQIIETVNKLEVRGELGGGAKKGGGSH